jgi:hypothetical protein
MPERADTLTGRHDVGRLFAAWAVWFWAINWGNVAGFLSAVFTLLLIADKLGVLIHLKNWGHRVWMRFRGLA